MTELMTLEEAKEFAADLPQVERPIVLLDVDGVVNWWGQTEPPGLIRHGQIWIPKEMKALLRDVRRVADVWWCTAWREMANDSISPLVGMPRLDVVTDFPLRAGGAEWKLDEVVRLIDDGAFGDRRLIWIEDFRGSWRKDRRADLEMVVEMFDGRITLVDTTRAGCLMREDLEGVLW
jgi:hypothetical protein